MSGTSLQVGTSGHFAVPADAVVRRSQSAERAGWDSIWWPDAQIGYHPTAPGRIDTPHEIYDWSPMIAAAAVSTERCRLGVSVTDPFRRHPAMLAQTAQTLYDLSNGRFILGLGLGAIENLTPFGIEGSGSIAILEEALDVMHLLWSTTDAVSFTGKRWSLDGAVLGVQSPVGRPPVFLGGTGPRSLNLTGRKADGWVPVMLTVDHYDAGWRTIQQAAEDAGRDPDSLTASCVFLSVAGEDDETLDRLLDTPWVRAIALSQPASQWERAGFTHPLGANASGMRDFIPTRYTIEAYEHLVKDIPLSAVKELVLWGDAKRLVARLREYEAVGMRQAVLWNVTGMGEATPDEIRSSYAVFEAVRKEFE